MGPPPLRGRVGARGCHPSGEIGAAGGRGPQGGRGRALRRPARAGVPFNTTGEARGCQASGRAQLGQGAAMGCGWATPDSDGAQLGRGGATEGRAAWVPLASGGASGGALWPGSSEFCSKSALRIYF